MAVGAFAAYNFDLRVPGLPLLAQLRRSAACSRPAVGIVFGLPSLRIKGFYLAVSTLAAQFFVQWALHQVRLVLERQRLRRDHRAAVVILGFDFDTPAAQYLLTLGDRRGDGARWRRTWCAARPGAPSWRCATWTSRPR